MFKLPAYLTGFGSKTDGSASIRFATQELSDTQFGLLKRHLNTFGWLIFDESELSEADIPKEELVEDKSKTPSKRLRSSLYVLWKQKDPQSDFEAFYRNQMERIINYVKDQIE